MVCGAELETSSKSIFIFTNFTVFRYILKNVSNRKLYGAFEYFQKFSNYNTYDIVLLYTTRRIISTQKLYVLLVKEDNKLA